VARAASERFRSCFAIAAWLVVAAVFALGSALAKSKLRAATDAAFPALALLDIATTPLPANPVCWEGLVAGEQGGQYRVLRATVALWPLGAAECKAGEDVQPTAPVRPISRANHDGVRWLTEYHTDIAELARLRRDDCRFRALLKFARLPYVATSRAMAGDLRYDRQPDRDFSDVELAARATDASCPRFAPGWAEPRAELFQP
jgi:hypothetical protein